jgi:N-methylhydantoinase A
MRAGIEIGGTFTDLVLEDDRGRIHTHKVSSTPDDPSRGAVTGLLEILEQAGIGIAAIDELFHGSTIATNTLLERKGARTALLTTSGFEDVLMIGRQDKTRVYDLFYRKPEPLIPRELVIGVRERMGADGTPVLALTDAEVARCVDQVLGIDGLESVAISLLHAYRVPDHERALEASLTTRAPHLAVATSSSIAPEFREYERTSTVAIAAYVMPRVSRYLSRLEHELAARGFRGRLLIMQSNGGVVPALRAAQNPAKMFLSGPAAGVTGVTSVLATLGVRDALTIDIGGTSCDACVISDGRAQHTQRGYAEYRIDGLPISLMMTDIATLGAGGGSIARQDPGGALQVGPQSAGAAPGPACYGKGGTAFTVSDALLLLGMIDADGFIGGRMRLQRGLAHAAADPLARRLGMTPLALADAVVRITVGNIARALRLVTVRRGYDPRTFALFAYGGAGPVMAAAIAAEMDIDTVIVPPAPGIFSAFGLSVADTRIDYVRSMPGTPAQPDAQPLVDAAFASMSAQALKEMADFGIAASQVVLSHSVDARYVGQGYELALAVDPAAIASRGLEVVATRFHAAHAARYGHDFPEQGVEIVGCRTVARFPRPPTVRQFDTGASTPAREVEIVFGGTPERARLVSRGALAPGERIAGPALVAEASSATVVPPGWSATATPQGTLTLHRETR